MKTRFIHSQEYTCVLRDLRARHPRLPIFIFTSEPPEPQTDNLETFRQYGAHILTQGECGIVQTFAVFATARIFVMGRSSFSYSPALLRDHATCTTVYRAFTHGRAHPNWRTWDSKGVI